MVLNQPWPSSICFMHTARFFVSNQPTNQQTNKQTKQPRPSNLSCRSSRCLLAFVAMPTSGVSQDVPRDEMSLIQTPQEQWNHWRTCGLASSSAMFSYVFPWNWLDFPMFLMLCDGIDGLFHFFLWSWFWFVCFPMELMGLFVCFPKAHKNLPQPALNIIIVVLKSLSIVLSLSLSFSGLRQGPGFRVRWVEPFPSGWPGSKGGNRQPCLSEDNGVDMPKQVKYPTKPNKNIFGRWTLRSFDP